jgi:hypothetical protein
MTRLLIGLTGGLYTWDLAANCGPGPVLAGVQPMALAMDPSEHGRVLLCYLQPGTVAQ